MSFMKIMHRHYLRRGAMMGNHRRTDTHQIFAVPRIPALPKESGPSQQHYHLAESANRQRQNLPLPTEPISM